MRGLGRSDPLRKSLRRQKQIPLRGMTERKARARQLQQQGNSNGKCKSKSNRRSLGCASLWLASLGMPTVVGMREDSGGDAGRQGWGCCGLSGRYEKVSQLARSRGFAEVSQLTGRSMMMLAPWGSWFTAWMRPRWSRTMAAQRLRPRPADSLPEKPVEKESKTRSG